MLDEINKQGVSVIISARNEAKTLPLTVGHLFEEAYTTGITKFEIVIVDNASTDETSRFFAWKAVEKRRHWKYVYSPRGMVYEGKLRIFFDPVCSNVGARTKGVGYARYENIIFADAHIITRAGTILSTVKTLNEFGGLVHSPVSWLGSSSENPSPSYQYSWKVGEKIWGTWNRLCINPTKPFYIPLSGHCWIAVKKKEFQEKGGYPLAQRVYGGGEPYLPAVWWMTGSTVVCDPNSLVYHLSAGRGYNWHSNDLLHNMMFVAYILGGKYWADRILITYINKIGGLTPTLELLYNEALEEGEPLKRWLDEHKIMTFEEMLGLNKENDCTKCIKRRHPEPHVMRVWDIKNEELYGYHRSYVTNFPLSKRDGKVYIGNTEIFVPQALELASKYV